MRDLKLGLYVITWTYMEMGRSHIDVARAALEGGADAVQLRDKDIGGNEMLRLAVQMRDIVDVREGDCLLFVNDRVDVAIASGADGVHLGQQDLPAAATRPIIGDGMILGISAETVQEARKARDDGADYLGVGPVFATPSKADAGDPIGIEGLKKIRGSVELPIVAIGGINEGNLKQVFEAGADGVAVISAVAAAEDMFEAVSRLRRTVDSCLAGR